jgi:hypothetical protein
MPSTKVISSNVGLAGLVAEELGALRRLAQDRRAASFVLFCNGGRLAQPFVPEMPEMGKVACSPGPTGGSAGEGDRLTRAMSDQSSATTQQSKEMAMQRNTMGR